MRVAEWRAQQRQIQGAAPGPLCRNLWIPGWFQPRFLSHPKSPSAGHKTAGCHQHPPFLSGWQLSPGTEGKEVGRVSAIVQNCKHPQWAAHCLSFQPPSCIEVTVTDLIDTKELWCKSWGLPWSSRACQWSGLSLNEPSQEKLWCWHWELWMKAQPESWVWRVDDPGDLSGCLCEQLRKRQKRGEKRLKHTFVTLTWLSLHKAI